LGFSSISDRLGEAKATQVHQAAGIVDVELAQVDIGRGKFRSRKTTLELDILGTPTKNNGLVPGINDKF
jgi:hypothetical protein